MVEFVFLGCSKDMFRVFEVAVTKDVMKTKRVKECHILTCRGCGKGWYMREIGGIIMKGTAKPTRKRLLCPCNELFIGDHCQAMDWGRWRDFSVRWN